MPKYDLPCRKLVHLLSAVLLDVSMRFSKRIANTFVTSQMRKRSKPVAKQARNPEINLLSFYSVKFVRGLGM